MDDYEDDPPELDDYDELTTTAAAAATTDSPAVRQDCDGWQEDAMMRLAKGGGKLAKKAGKKAVKVAVEQFAEFKPYILLGNRIKMFDDWAKDKSDAEVIKASTTVWAHIDAAKAKALHAAFLNNLNQSTIEAMSKKNEKIQKYVKYGRQFISKFSAAETDAHTELIQAFKGLTDVTDAKAQVTMAIAAALTKNDEHLHYKKLSTFFAVHSVSASMPVHLIGAYVLHACHTSVDDDFQRRAAYMTEALRDHHAELCQLQASAPKARIVDVANIHSSLEESEAFLRSNARSVHGLRVAPLLSVNSTPELTAMAFELFKSGDTNLQALETAAIQGGLAELNAKSEVLLTQLKCSKFEMDTTLLSTEKIGMPTGLQFLMAVASHSQ